MITEPSFLIIGAQRCGTTSLYYILNEHPQIYMAKPLQPEPKFFISDECFRMGKDFYLKQWFSKCGNAKITGEKSTSYLEVPGTAERISRMFPTMKLIIILRNPIERALSNYKFSVKNGLEQENFKTAIYNEKERIKNLKFLNVSVHPLAYLHRGLYSVFIKEYYKFFSKEQLCILFFDDMKKGDETFYKKLYQFLGVDDNYHPKGTKKIINLSQKTEILIDNNMLEYMQKFFFRYNKELEELTGRDLSIWENSFLNNSI